MTGRGFSICRIFAVSILQIALRIIWLGSFSGAFLLEQAGVLGVDGPCAQPRPHGGAAVSYTHLDVYKRQRHGCHGVRQSLGGVQGALFKGRPCWGRQPQLPGAKPPHPLGRAHGTFASTGRKCHSGLLHFPQEVPPPETPAHFQQSNI